MPVKGRIGYAEVPLYICELENISGQFVPILRRAGGEIHVHEDQHGVHFLDTVIHELLHAIGRHRGIEGRKLTHSAVYTIANDLAQWLHESGAIDVKVFEKQLRKLAKKR